MPKDYLPQNDHEYLLWAQNFVRILEEFQVESGLTPTQVQEIADEVANYANDLGTSDNKTQESIAANHQKDTSRDSSKSRIRQSVKFIKVQPAMPEAALIGMKVTIDSDTRTRQTAQAPTHLYAELQADGAVHLEWDANGNTYGVQYVIERHAGIGTSGEFIIVGTTTRRSFVYTGADAAEPAMYRVRAQRSDTVSGYSNTANIGV